MGGWGAACRSIRECFAPTLQMAEICVALARDRVSSSVEDEAAAAAQPIRGGRAAACARGAVRVGVASVGGGARSHRDAERAIALCDLRCGAGGGGGAGGAAAAAGGQAGVT